MTRGDTLVALPFMALILATFARHNTLPFQKRGGLLQTSGQYHYQQQQHQPTQLPSPPDEAGGPVPPPPLPDAMVREGDTYHLPLAALRHGLRDALAWNEALALNNPIPGTHPPPDFLIRARASFFFGESNGTTFSALRDLYGLGTREYLSSLESGFEVFASNSKSRQFFCFTGDKKFIIKTMSGEELRALTAILADYHTHMAANPRSLLVHYCGHYHVKLYREQTDEWEDIHFLVMRNLMTPPKEGLTVRELYDVKGSTVGRAASEKDKAKESGGILKDLDLMERQWPIDFGRERENFLRQMSRDVDFLRAKGVMDYSLLLGVCPVPVGISGMARGLGNEGGKGGGFPSRMLNFFLGPPGGTGGGGGGGEGGGGGGGGGGGNSQTGWVVVHPEGREVYVAGVIDVLQLYNRRKLAETLLKSVVYKREAISAVDPVLYAARFLQFVERIVQQQPQEGRQRQGVGGGWAPAKHQHQHQQPPPPPSSYWGA
ncbi:hypothetical protein VYU27_001915 [Nannochloropsis oceanica]